MCEPEPTVAAILAQFDGSAAGAAAAFLLAQDHDARVAAIQKGIDFACNELEQNKAQKQNCGEDALTTDICSMLRMAGFQAAHDYYVNGHCDIVVRGKDKFLWLAEAKKHNDYAWLDKGFHQLATRYSTGAKGQDCGEVLIYCFVKDAKTMLQNWRNELLKRNPDVSTGDAPCDKELVFSSSHQHEATGLHFRVRHKAVALHWPF